MPSIDQIFYWCGAVIATSVAVIFTACLALFAGWLVKKACNYWWDRTLTIYRLESIRHYFQIMVKNGRTGLLKEVEQSDVEAKARRTPPNPHTTSQPAGESRRGGVARARNENGRPDRACAGLGCS